MSFCRAAVWHCRCTRLQVAADAKLRFLRFSLGMFIRCRAERPIEGPGQGWKIGRLTPRLGPRNQSPSQPCIVKRRLW